MHLYGTKRDRSEGVVCCFPLYKLKFFFIHMTMLSLKRQPFFPTHVLAQARRRIRRKLEGAKEGIRICVIQAEAKEREPKLHQYIGNGSEGLDT